MGKKQQNAAIPDKIEKEPAKAWQSWRKAIRIRL
jgi:hypothetical protein